VAASRVVWGQIVVVFAIVLFAVWMATQWTAWRLGFQPQLGSPWFSLAGLPVYPPPAFFWWWFFYDAYAPRIFLEGAGIAASGGLVAIAVAILMSIYRAREAKDVRTFGSARWADPHEIASAGLLGDDGVVLGKLDRNYLRHDGAEHVLCFAPTRREGRRSGGADAADWPGLDRS
jgi:type IV secretion system protein VirD4